MLETLVTLVWLLIVVLVYLGLYLFCNYRHWRRKDGALPSFRRRSSGDGDAADSAVSISLDESSSDSNESHALVEGDFV